MNKQIFRNIFVCTLNILYQRFHAVVQPFHVRNHTNIRCCFNFEWNAFSLHKKKRIQSIENEKLIKISLQNLKKCLFQLNVQWVQPNQKIPAWQPIEAQPMQQYLYHVKMLRQWASYSSVSTTSRTILTNLNLITLDEDSNFKFSFPFFIRSPFVLNRNESIYLKFSRFIQFIGRFNENVVKKKKIQNFKNNIKPVETILAPNTSMWFALP